nr:L-lactate permease [Kineosphaera limosa]
MAILPVLAVGAAVASGLRATGAAVSALLAVGVAVALRYPLDVAAARADIIRWLPLMVEILLIIGGGLVLAALTTRTGSQQVLARRLAAAAGTPVVTVLLVVHGITPFAESVMGFGIGAMIGVPLLLHVGIPPARAAIVSLLGLAAVPWGAMAPGILVAAGMTGLSFQELGVASARLSLLPFVVCGIAGVLVAFGRRARLLWLLAAAGTGIVFWLGVIGANIVAGTPPAGALGALVTILVVLAARQAQRAFAGRRGHGSAEAAGHAGQGHDGSGSAGRPTGARTDETIAVPGSAAPAPCNSSAAPAASDSSVAELVRALLPYVVLLGGVLIARAAVHSLPDEALGRYIASPGLWLAVACLSEYLLHRTELTRRTVREAGLSAWHSWRVVAPATASFVLVGILMVDAGMTAQIAVAATALGPAYSFFAPTLAGIGGFLTGSNAGANAMFAAPQAQAAHALGKPVLDFVAMQNVGASLLTMASPGRVLLAVRMCPPGSVSMRTTTLVLVAIDAVVLVGLGVLALAM